MLSVPVDLFMSGYCQQFHQYQQPYLTEHKQGATVYDIEILEVKICQLPLILVNYLTLLIIKYLKIHNLLYTPGEDERITTGYMMLIKAV
jgi:hypothetical protein